MIQFDLIPQYTRVVPGIRFRQNAKNPFLIVYFSENSTLSKDYFKLGFKRPDVRHVVIPKTRIPVTRLEPKSRDIYKSLGLLPFSATMAFPKNKNLFFDLSMYLTAIEDAYNPSTYRQRAGFLVQDALYKSFNVFPSNYKKVLIYAVDVTQDIRSFLDRKVFPLVRQLKAGEIYFAN
jgi:hypothetical protein